MQPINFFLIFALCLALVLFGIQNTELTTIHIVADLDVSAPLSVEIILAAGAGAVLAWVSGLWMRFGQAIASGKTRQQARQQQQRIQDLEQELQTYQIEEPSPQLAPGEEEPKGETKAE